MKITKSILRVFVLIIPVLVLSGCDWWDSDSSNEFVESDDSGIYFDISSVDYAAISVNENSLEPGARQLAAQCAQCHGTYGVAVRNWPDLWGSDRGITSAMQDYQSETYADNVMHMHALAYTPEEVELLKSYYPKVDYAAGE